MRHLRIYEEYSKKDLEDLISDLRAIGAALTEDEEDMLNFVNQFGGGKSPEEYAEYLYDYFTNPEEYDIDPDGDYYDMIWYLYENSVEDHARFNPSGPMKMGSYQRWDENAISNEPLYKSYLKMSNYYKNSRK